MRGPGYADRTGLGITGTHPHAAIGILASISGETGAIYQGSVVAEAAAGISGIWQEVLGAAFVGTRILLRDGGYEGRSYDPGVY
jgi:hypothetical protein